MTRYYAIVEYAETIAPSGDCHRRILTHIDAPILVWRPLAAERH